MAFNGENPIDFCHTRLSGVTPISIVPKVAFRSRESKRQNWDDAEAIVIDLNLGVATV